MTDEELRAAIGEALAEGERNLEVPKEVEDRVMERLRQQGIVGPRTRLGAEDLARVDRQARERGVSRDAMLTALVISGLAVCEMAAREVPAGPGLRPTDPMGEGWQSPAPSPWLGWAILVVVGLVVGLGGWALVRVLDQRARPVLPPVTSISGALPPAPAPAPPAAPEPRPGLASSTSTAASAPARRAAPPPRLTTTEIRDPWGG